jgi:N-formylglutamate amidohydrolase
MPISEIDVPVCQRNALVRPMPFSHIKPNNPRGATIVTCPHSGRFYPPELLAATRLDAFGLRRSEDAFVDLMFEDAPNVGAELFCCEFARAFVDLNRGLEELDPELVTGLDPSFAYSQRVKAGLGVIPRTVGEGVEIYHHMISARDAQDRLDEVYLPWHDAIESSIGLAKAKNGTVVLLDCHSMPASASGNTPCDVVIGDRFGESCRPIFTNVAVQVLRSAGLSVSRNNPFAGGFMTKRYGKPQTSVNALQIEINRSIYMVEGSFKLRPEFTQIKNIMTQLVTALTEVSVKKGG